MTKPEEKSKPEKNFKDEPRHYGLELEFVGPAFEHSAQIMAKSLGVEAKRDHNTRYHYHIEGIEDPFILELDFKLAQELSAYAEKKRQGHHSKDMDTQLLDQLDRGTIGAVEGVVPSEIVTPPLKYDQLHLVRDLVEAFRKAGAKGTSESLLYAFGYHINPEARSLESEALLSVIKSFSLLHDYLQRHLSMDFSRILTGYAAPYKKAYLKKIMAPSYAPDKRDLMLDYIKLNKSRNYALDMFPLFAFMDNDFFKRHIQDDLVKARPTYHFRLPNCQINDSAWSIDDGLKAWDLVEKLSDDKDLLDKLTGLYRTHKGSFFKRLTQNWADIVEMQLRAKGWLD